MSTSRLRSGATQSGAPGRFVSVRLPGRRFPLIAITAAALLFPGAASGATTMGSPLTSAPEKSAFCGSGTFTNTALATGLLKAPFDGVIVRWRLAISTGAGAFAYKLRVLRPAGGKSYTAVGTGPAQLAPLAGANLLTLPTPLPIEAGDIIGVDCPNGAPTPASVTAPSGSTYAFFTTPPLAEGDTKPVANQIPGDEELIAADVVGAPVLTAATPSLGPTAGGTAVTIAGSRLAEVTAVTFGGVPATDVTALSDSEVRATAPPHAAGAADVRAGNVAGQSPTVAAGSFTYVAPPVLGKLSQSHATWRAGGRLATLFARATPRPPLGTVFSFSLNQAEGVSLAFSQKLAGHKRAAPRGTLSLSGHKGQNRVRFQGRVSPKRKLGPGRYRVTVTATNALGKRSAARSLSFTIVR